MMTELFRHVSPYMDHWLLPGCIALFLGWLLSKYAVWLPWCTRHPIAVDLLLILGCSWFITAPLTQFGAPGGHDSYFHTSRVAELHWLMRDGVVYGRWTPDFNYGFGYPLLNFYPPLIYYPAQLFRALGVSVSGSLNWVIAGGVWFSGLFMYLLGKEFWGRYGGVVCAVAYLYAPYRIVNLYVRGAIPEFFAMTFMPLIFWSVYKLIHTKHLTYLGIGALAYGLMIPAHNVTVLFFSIVLAAYALLLAIENTLWPSTLARPRFMGKILALNIGYAAGMGVAGIGVAAVYWLPAMVEKQFVKIGSLQSGYHDLAVHFVYFAQFFSRFWGYGGSGAGPDDGMSFQLGIEHVLLAIVALAAVFTARRATSHQKRHVAMYVVLIGGLMFAMTSPSLPIWRAVPLISFISFPWRLLSITAFALSFLAGGIFVVDFGRRVAWLNRAIQLLLIGLILAFTVGYCQPESLLPLTDEHYSREMMRLSDGAALNPEYEPIWSNTYGEQITPNEIQVMTGDATLHDVASNTVSYALTIDAATPATLRIGMLYFPGWTAYRDEQRIELIPEPDTGLLMFSVPAGPSSITVRFEDIPIRTFARYLSLVSVGFVGILLVFFGFRRMPCAPIGSRGIQG